MAREYVLSTGNSTLTTVAGTLLTINPSTTVGFEVIRAWCGQAANATSAQQRIQLATVLTSFAISNSAITPGKLKYNDPTSLFTANANVVTSGRCGTACTTEQTGTPVVLWEDAFNVLNGWLWVPTPRETIVIPPNSGAAFSMRFPTAPATNTGWAFGIVYSEI